MFKTEHFASACWLNRQFLSSDSL